MPKMLSAEKVALALIAMSVFAVGCARHRTLGTKTLNDHNRKPQSTGSQEPSVHSRAHDRRGVSATGTARVSRISPDHLPRLDFSSQRDAINRRRFLSRPLIASRSDARRAPRLLPDFSRTGDQVPHVGETLRLAAYSDQGTMLTALGGDNADFPKIISASWYSDVSGSSSKSIQTSAQQPDNQTVSPASGSPDEPPPKPGTKIRIPLRKLLGTDKVQLSGNRDRITLKVREAPLNAVLAVIAQQQQLNIVSASDVTDTVSVTLHNVPLQDALDSLMSIAGCTWVNRGGIIFVSKINAKSGINPDIQGRKLQVIPLNFIAAADIEKAVQGLLSPAGQVFVTQVDPLDKRKTREQLVIEDLPWHVARIVRYVAQVDRPPRQVLIEVHILQVRLTDEIRHGVNFEYLQKVAGKDLALAAVGFADPLAVTASFFSIRGNHLEALLEALKQTTDAKTLASPKLMVLNGQRAKIQIGERLGYLVTTTTETSTLQNVQFLDVGVVLEVTPQITADNRVLMYLKTKVSGGQINDGLPEEETTEVDTTVMMSDGQGIIIGGLIQEFDEDRQSKIPLIGDFWLLGRLFQRRFARKERVELIFALVPRIVPLDAPRDERAESEWNRASTRLFDRPLERRFRPWEPGLPDAMRNPRRVRFDRLPRAIPNLRESHPLPADYYFPPASKNPRVRPTEYPERFEFRDLSPTELPGDFYGRLNRPTVNERQVDVK